jgi:hypothetical protein
VTHALLLRLGLWAAVLGGALRIAAAFVPYTPQSPPLEAFYALIDVSILFGLAAIYAREAEALGWPGLIAFAVAFAGLASIVGPDATMFGIDWYQAGATMAALGLAAFGAALLFARRMIVAALCWIAVPAVATIAPPLMAFQAAGVLFGLGFVMTGFSAPQKYPLSAKASRL